MQKAAVFLDKDGTLIPDIPYNVDTDKIKLTEGADRALIRLYAKGFIFVIVTNQSGIAKGYFSENDLETVKSKLISLFDSLSINLDGFYYCPHHPEGTLEKYRINCDCRKPMPGLILSAAKDLDIDLSKSWFIGDILNDIEAGNRAGCFTILLDNGNETEWIDGEFRKPDFTVNGLIEAADIIIANTTQSKGEEV